MKLIVGLGNPGEKYEKTRHNLGFLVVERFLRDFSSASETVWNNEDKFKSDISKLEWQPKHGKLERVLLVKPTTFMNNSGQAVKLLSSFYKVEPDDIWIVHDEIDIPLGNMKIRFGGSSAGHRGIDSIMQQLGTEKFWRFRLGIGSLHGQAGLRRYGTKSYKMKDVDEHVLGNFGRGEWGKTRELIKHGSKALSTALEKGLHSAMNQFNTK